VPLGRIQSLNRPVSLFSADENRKMTKVEAGGGLAIRERELVGKVSEDQE
jgi:hypothetical protein